MRCVTDVEQWRVEFSVVEKCTPFSEMLHARETLTFFDLEVMLTSGLGDEVLRVEHVVSKSTLYRELCVMMKRLRWEGLQDRSC